MDELPLAIHDSASGRFKVPIDHDKKVSTLSPAEAITTLERLTGWQLPKGREIVSARSWKQSGEGRGGFWLISSSQSQEDVEAIRKSISSREWEILPVATDEYPDLVEFCSWPNPPTPYHDDGISLHVSGSEKRNFIYVQYEDLL